MINIAEDMKHLHQLAKRNPSKRFHHLCKKIIQPEWLAQAWEQIRRNRGSQTAGVDDTIAHDVDMRLIHKLAEELKTNTYRPMPVRRVHIPKANGKTRPLGIPTIKDRIVQQALKMLLEPIFEADFLACSHGFRQGRSTHTALRDVARYYPHTSYVIEGDIEGCFDNIPHGKLLDQIGRRVGDKRILNLVKLFLSAGYLEDWQYHQTYSGTPQGGIISPLLANLFLHQLDQFLVNELAANLLETKQQRYKRRNPEYRKIERRITTLRKSLKAGDAESRKLLIKELREAERQRRRTPYYDKDQKPPCKIKYVRYADDFVILVAENRKATEAIKNKVNEKLSACGLRLSEEKTKITHWSHPIRFLGYDIQGKLRRNGIAIRAILSIPKEKVDQVKDAITRVCGYYQIPEADALVQTNAIFTGWCNYYRFANSPQPTFNELVGFIWWQYAHFLARKQRCSIAQMIHRERKAGRLGEIRKGHRKRLTFQRAIGERILTLNLFPPKTVQIRRVPTSQDWQVDLRPVNILDWQSGRSLATRLAALDRAKGLCERCKQQPISNVHHIVGLRRKSFLGRVMSDQSQRETAIALCKECHLAAHGGSYGPKRKRLSGSAGYAERCSSGAGSAS